MRERRRFAVAIGAAMAMALSGVSIALAAETTRSEYVAAVEPICHRDTQANERALADVRSEVREGKLRPAAVKFERAGKALKGALRELKAVPRPTADAQRLKSWFADIEVEIGLFDSIAGKLRAGQKAAAERLSPQLTRATTQANDQVLGFEFRYCSVQPSQFT